MKFIINWNAGYGDTYEVIEANNLEEAKKSAYQSWLEEADSNAVFGAKEYSEDLAMDCGLLEEEE